MARVSATSSKLPKKSQEKPARKSAKQTTAKPAQEKKTAPTLEPFVRARATVKPTAPKAAIKRTPHADEKNAQERAAHRRKKKEEQENAQIRAYLTDPLDLFAKRGARASASLSSDFSFGSSLSVGRARAAVSTEHSKALAPQADALTSTEARTSSAQNTQPAAPVTQGLRSPAPAGGRHEITVRDLHKHFGKKRAVNGISFNIFSGEVVGFLGPNGAGKTTVFYMIVGFLKPNKGSILFDGTDVTKFPMYKRAQAGISYLPQEASVFRQLSVEKNIMAVLQTVRTLSGAERKKRLDFLLDEFGLTALRRQKAYTLSGGERRRTEIARGMALNPKFLLLDEPFTGIDPKARYELKQIIASLARQNVGVLITDHNERDTLSITDRAFIVHDGHIVAAGSHDEIMRNVKVREIYLGENYS